MIFVAAAVIIISAIGRLDRARHARAARMWDCSSPWGASAVNGGAAWVLHRVGTRERSATLVADAKHLATDVVTSAAVLVGVGLVAVFDSPVLDAIVALGTGMNIMWTGVQARQRIRGRPHGRGPQPGGPGPDRGGAGPVPS